MSKEVTFVLQKFEVLSEMHKGYSVAVIEGKIKKMQLKFQSMHFKGGIRSLEVTFSTPGAEEAIAELVSH